MSISRHIDRLPRLSPEDRQGARDLMMAALGTAALVTALGLGLHAGAEAVSNKIDEHFAPDSANSQPTDEPQGGLVGIFDNLTDK